MTLEKFTLNNKILENKLIDFNANANVVFMYKIDYYNFEYDRNALINLKATIVL